MSYPTNRDNIVDSRDVIVRLQELEDLTDGVVLDEETSEWMCDGVNLDEEVEERDALRSLCDEASKYTSDWDSGEALICETYFTEYAEDFARDIYDLPTSWPTCHIDWEAAAKDLKQDYTEVDWAGATYLVRVS